MVEEANTSHGRSQWKGRTRANKWVFFPQDELTSENCVHPGDMVSVRIERTTAWSLQGCAVAV